MVVYTVYADDKLIHHSESSSSEVKLINPKLSMEENSSGSFSCTIPPSNVGYDFVTRITTDIPITISVFSNSDNPASAVNPLTAGAIATTRNTLANFFAYSLSLVIAYKTLVTSVSVVKCTSPSTYATIVP